MGITKYKNENIKNLKNIIPEKIRLEIYRETLEDERDLIRSGLCLALPIYLWNLDNYLSNSPNNTKWDYRETFNAFPEFEEIFDQLEKDINSLTNSIHDIRLYNIATLGIRKHYLTEMIKSLKAKLDK